MKQKTITLKVSENTKKAYDDGLAKNLKGIEDGQSKPVNMYINNQFSFILDCWTFDFINIQVYYLNQYFLLNYYMPKYCHFSLN